MPTHTTPEAPDSGNLIIAPPTIGNRTFAARLIREQMDHVVTQLGYLNTGHRVITLDPRAEQPLRARHVNVQALRQCKGLHFLHGERTPG